MILLRRSVVTDPILDSGGGLNPVAGAVLRAMLEASNVDADDEQPSYSLDKYDVRRVGAFPSADAVFAWFQIKPEASSSIDRHTPHPACCVLEYRVLHFRGARSRRSVRTGKSRDPEGQTTAEGGVTSARSFFPHAPVVVRRQVPGSAGARAVRPQRRAVRGAAEELWRRACVRACVILMCCVYLRCDFYGVCMRALF
jgi:hypothetical protein